MYASAALIGEMESFRRGLLAPLQLQECSVTGSKSIAKVIKVATEIFSETALQDIFYKIPIDLRAVHVQVEKNIWLHGYEADIVLRVIGSGNRRYGKLTVPVSQSKKVVYHRGVTASSATGACGSKDCEWSDGKNRRCSTHSERLIQLI